MAERTPSPPNMVNPQPATPRRVGDIASSAKLLSTPSNRGSASLSEHLFSASVEHVKPSILADIERHKTCTVENLLNGMLSLCLPEDQKHDPPTDLLKQCLEAVLPICNVKTSDGHDCARDSSVKTKGEQGHGDNLRGWLTKYLANRCNRSSTENSSYLPFVFAFNHALQALRDIDVPLRRPTREPTDLLLFHRNDPKNILSVHNGHRSKRKPDIVLVSLPVVNNASSDGEGSWADLAFKRAGKCPESGFEWGDCFSAVEIKWTNKQMREQLPEEYAARPVKSIPPLWMDINSHTKLGRMQPSAESTAQISENSEPQSTLQPRASRSFTSKPKASSSRKRKIEQGEESSNKRVKATSLESLAILQGALYAAGRLSHAIWIGHAINLVIVDTVAYVWWYDNEGAIQSYGIDFVEDLPYFLVLLLCFERFTPKDWGIVSQLKPESKKAGLSFSLPSAPSLEISIDETDKIRDHYGIVGRATQMLTATSQSKDPRDPAKNLKGMDLVLKVYWPEASRTSEVDIINKACQIAQQNDDVKGHLPDLIYSQDFVKYSTKEIRTAFGIKVESETETDAKSHRVLRVILFRQLYPITDLTGDKFWAAFWQCFRCHYCLWVGGVRHGDISVKNLMYDKLNGDCGVLNDYDLAHLNGRISPTGAERTGTMPFMAFDLLTNRAWAGLVERLYRHDCESFAWVLLWICSRYDDGEEICNPPLSKFITHSYEECYNAKASTFQWLGEAQPTASYERFWPVVLKLLRWVHGGRHRTENRFLKKIETNEATPPVDEEEEPRKVFEIYWEARSSAL